MSIIIYGLWILFYISFFFLFSTILSVVFFFYIKYILPTQNKKKYYVLVSQVYLALFYKTALTGNRQFYGISAENENRR